MEIGRDGAERSGGIRKQREMAGSVCFASRDTNGESRCLSKLIGQGASVWPLAPMAVNWSLDSGLWTGWTEYRSRMTNMEYTSVCVIMRFRSFINNSVSLLILLRAIVTWRVGVECIQMIPRYT